MRDASRQTATRRGLEGFILGFFNVDLPAIKKSATRREEKLKEKYYKSPFYRVVPQKGLL